MKIYAKAKAIVDRDVKNMNETKRASVIMRLFAIVMCWFFLIQGVSMSAYREWDCAIVSFICMFGYMGAFYATYLNRTGIALLYTMCSTIGWIVLYVVMLGWDCGAQHFLFVLVVFFFTVSHMSTRSKVVMSAFLCIIRLSLYWYTKLNPPIIPMESRVLVILQMINTISIFGALTVIVILFCHDSLTMERKLVLYNEKLREATRRDPLTTLYNRRAMMEYLNEMIERVERYGNWFNVAIGDIDFFKKVNDTYGHEAGDAVLIHVAELLSSYMKGKGCVGRWGGEEFLLVFKDVNGEDAFIELEKIRSLIERQKIEYKGQTIQVTMTFGLDEYNNNKPIDYTINSADQKLYLGKTQGRNRVIF